MKNKKKYIFIFFILYSSRILSDQSIQPLISINTSSMTGDYSMGMQILLLMTAFSFLPGLIMAMTSFTRIIIILSILRQALGLAQTPTNQILIGISLFLTFFIMSPVFKKINDEAVDPYINNKISQKQAFTNAQIPLKKFILDQTRKNDLNLFSDLANTKVSDAGFSVLLPAFITSEMKTAFQIGFIIFLPFLIIDLIVASVLMSMGMMMLSPLIVSLPFKIMLFVLIDGWNLILGSIASSFTV